MQRETIELKSLEGDKVVHEVYEIIDEETGEMALIDQYETPATEEDLKMDEVETILQQS